MPIDAELVGRSYPPTEPYEVSEESVKAFDLATGGTGEQTDPVPTTYPIVVAFIAMNAFLEAEQVELQRIVHGEQRFEYERPVRVGDRLTAVLGVDSVRSVSGTDIVGASVRLTDDEDALVCTARSTLIHRRDA